MRESEAADVCTYLVGPRGCDRESAADVASPDSAARVVPKQRWPIDALVRQRQNRADALRTPSAAAVTGVGHRLADLNRGEILERAGAGAVGVVPVGSLEQHGEHLPVGTDAMVAEEVCLRAAARAATDVLVAPPIWTGFSPHHLRFGATASLRAETFLTLLRDVVGTIRPWLPRLVLVNGHGGNRGPLTTVAIEQGCLVLDYWELVDADLTRELFPADLGSIGHAGEAETSMVLAIAPARVGSPGDAFEPIPRPNESFLVPDMGASGVLGNPAAATAEAGERFLDAVVTALADYLDHLPTTKEVAI